MARGASLDNRRNTGTFQGIKMDKALLDNEKRKGGIALTQVNAPVNVEAPVTVNVDVSKLQEVTNKVVDEVAKQLPTVGTKMYRGLITALSGRQSNTT